MILAYAGRRASSLAGDADLVAERIQRLIAGLSPTAVVGAAADGTDLLVLEAALAAADKPHVHVVLPTARVVFAQESVEPEWRQRFEAVIDEVSRREGSTVRTLDLDPGEAAYQAANTEFINTAAQLQGEEQRVVALVVAREGEGQMVEHLLTRARLRRIPTLRIDPTIDVASRPKCFVAMPFGRKPDTQRKIEVNCNEVYEKVLIPALENAQLNYCRADEEIDSGIVLEPMIEWIATADLVIGDLGTSNFNVGWELGLRHVLRPGQTLLIAPAGTTAPFDLAALRHVRYEQAETGISDEAVIEAWRKLGPYLARVGNPVEDSPVASVMEIEWGQVRRRTARDERWESLRSRLALARDLSDADHMLAVIDDADGLSDEHLRFLRAEVGVGLVRLGRFEEARPLLHQVVKADRDVQRPEAHVYYAQSVYRPKSASRLDLNEAERALMGVLVRRPSHPEVRALLGAVIKRRLQLPEGPAPQAGDLRAAMQWYLHDLERDLNLYYEGINVVALGAMLYLGFGDEDAGCLARELLPTVRVAAKFASIRPDDRFWALATIAECALHQQLLDRSGDFEPVRAAYHEAGALRPPDGYLDSTLGQLDFLTALGQPLGIPPEPLVHARAALLDGADKQA